MTGTEFKAGDRVRFKSQENMKGVSMWFEDMLEDLPKEFKITSIVNCGKWNIIYGHDTKYTISDKMLELVGSTLDNGMPNPYGTSVCDAIKDTSVFLSKADYERSQEYFIKKHSKKEHKKRITFSKVQ